MQLAREWETPLLRLPPSPCPPQTAVRYWLRNSCCLVFSGAKCTSLACNTCGSRRESLLTRANVLLMFDGCKSDLWPRDGNGGLKWGWAAWGSDGKVLKRNDQQRKLCDTELPPERRGLGLKRSLSFPKRTFTGGCCCPLTSAEHLVTVYWVLTSGVVNPLWWENWKECIYLFIYF